MVDIPFCSVIVTSLKVILTDVGDMAYHFMGDCFGIILPEWEEVLPMAQDMWYYYKVMSTFE